METAKKSHKKLWITLTAVVVILAILVFLVLGMLRGFDPGNALYNDLMAKEPGNAATYDFDQIERLKGNPLEGKHLCVLGSSVTYGAASLQNSLGEYFQQRFGMRLTKEAVSGTTLADFTGSSYVDRIQDIDKDADIELYMHDDIHPTKAGYREWWCPEMEKQLLAYYNTMEK